ncbi:MAG: hypothetical protein ACOYL6_02725 [Bacteriovoracaceae bacterium]
MEQDIKKIERIKLIVFAVFGLCFFLTRSLRSFTKYPLWYDHYTNIPSGANTIGMDFNAVASFCYDFFHTGNAYIHESSVYPPFLVLFNLLYYPFKTLTAYRIHASIIFFLLPLCLYLMTKIIKKSSNQSISYWAGDFFLFGLICLLGWNSYPLKFAMERGNGDLHALTFGIIGLYFTIKEEQKFLPSIIFFSLAAHYKIHPLIWYLIPVFRYGFKKTFFPFLITNLILLFCLGPYNLWGFIHNVLAVGNNPYIWVGNHSIASFYHLQFVEKGMGNDLIKYGLYLIGVLPWLIFLLNEKFKTFDAYRTLFYFLLCLPIMCYLPSQSHDYKLTMMFVVHFAFACIILGQIKDKISWGDGVILFINFFFCMMQTRSYDMGPKGWNTNKFLYLLGTEYMLYFWWILKERKKLVHA